MSSTRRLAAIMFTDVVGFTAAAQADEAGTLRRLHDVEGLVRPLIPQHHGREVKSTGDGLLVEFDSALKAVECAVQIQEAVRARNAERPGERLQLRVGVHVGDVEERDRDVLGDAVNVAARVVTAADPGGVCVSQQVFDHVRNKVPYRFERIPAQNLKGLRGPVDLYRVELSGPIGGGPRAPGGSTRLAVLPLSNISPDPKDEYFADGLTEELIAVLSQLRGLRVIARTSVAQYKGSSKSIAQIGEELAVDSVVEGSVRRAGNQIRITLQLIEVASQEHLWANSYNRELTDVFAVQAEIAQETAKALRTQVLDPGPTAGPGPPSIAPAAYEAYLKGMVVARTPGPHRLQLAAQLFEEATRIEPKFAAAYSRWAHIYALGLAEVISLREAYPVAERLVRKALELDPSSSEAHMAAASLAFQGDRDWARAEREFRRAIELNPSNDDAYLWLGILYFVLQRYAEAVGVLTTAAQLNPTQETSAGWRAWSLLLSGDFDGGVAGNERVYAAAPRRAMAVVLAATYAVAGRRGDALRTLDTAPSGAPSLAFDYYAATIRAQLGDPEPVRALLAAPSRTLGGEYLSAARIAGLHASVGELDRALELLERDFEDGDKTLWWEYQDVAFNRLRGDPRFRSLLRRYRLPEEPPPALRPREPSSAPT